MTPSATQPELTESDRSHLRTAIDLAHDALEAGDAPFGSVLVDADDTVLHFDRNRTNSVDPTRHPEFELARWAGANLSEVERRSAVVYTSGEHCPMCSSAHALVGLGRIVYAASGQQLAQWRQEWGLTPGPVTARPIQEITPGIEVHGPVAEFTEEVRELQQRAAGVSPQSSS